MDMNRPWTSHVDALADWAWSIAGRRDAFGRYIPPERRKPKGRAAYTEKAGLSLAVLKAHFLGECVVGVYLLHPDGTCRMGVVDIDRHDDRGSREANERAAIALHDRALGMGLSPILEDSDGKGSFKLWIAFGEPVPAGSIRRLLRSLVRDWKATGLASEPEIFPKQDALAPGGLGNFVRLPGRHHSREHWSRIWGGNRWLEGGEAARRLLATPGSKADAIPAEFRSGSATRPAIAATATTQAAGASAGLVGMLRSAIGSLPAGYPGNYEECIKAGMSLRGLGDVGLELWEAICRRCPRHREGFCREKWGTFDPGGGLSYRSILREARRNGWKHERRSKAPVGVAVHAKPTKLPASPIAPEVDPAASPPGRAEDPGGSRGDGRAGSRSGNGTVPPGANAPPAAQGPGVNRPEIVWNDRQIHPVTEEALAALRLLNSPPRLFAMGASLVRIRTDGSGVRTEPLDEYSLRGYLDRSALWLKEFQPDKPGKDSQQKAPKRCVTYPPEAIAFDILSLDKWPSEVFPPLRGIVRCPVPAEDGDLIHEPGYHRPSGSYFEPDEGLVVPPVPSSPTDDELAGARDLLLGELLVDIPFKTDSDRANALAYLLTPLARNLFTGPTPLGLIEAPVMGTGKSLLARCLAVPAVGRLSSSTQPENDAEWRKAITAKLVGAPPMILYDNLAKKLESSALEEVLTSSSWSDRELGATRTITVPVRCTWLATANNLQIKGDLHRRIVWIRLEVAMERPEDRDPSEFRHPDLMDWALRNRGELLRAALVLIRAWVARGRPPGPQSMGSYESWARTVGGILKVAGVDGFLSVQKKRRVDSDEIAGHWEVFLGEVHRRIGSQRFGVKDLAWVVDRDHPEFDDELLPALLTEDDKGDRRKRLGWGLSQNESRVFGRYQLVRAGEESRGKTAQYEIHEVEVPGQETIDTSRWGEAVPRQNPLILKPADDDRSRTFWEQMTARGLQRDELEDFGGQLWEACLALWLACEPYRLLTDRALIRLAEASGIFPRMYPSPSEPGRMLDFQDRLADINHVLEGLMRVEAYDRFRHDGRMMTRYAILDWDDVEARAQPGPVQPPAIPPPSSPEFDVEEYLAPEAYETLVELCCYWWLFEPPILSTMQALALVHEFNLLPGFSEAYCPSRQQQDLEHILLGLHGVEFDGFAIHWRASIGPGLHPAIPPHDEFQIERIRGFVTPAAPYNRRQPRYRRKFRKSYRISVKDWPRMSGAWDEPSRMLIGSSQIPAENPPDTPEESAATGSMPQGHSA